MRSSQIKLNFNTSNLPLLRVLLSRVLLTPVPELVCLSCTPSCALFTLYIEAIVRPTSTTWAVSHHVGLHVPGVLRHTEDVMGAKLARQLTDQKPVTRF